MILSFSTKTQLEIMYKVPYRCLKIKNSEHRKTIIKAFNLFLKKGQFLMGSEVQAFEKKVANYCQRKFCVGVSSGTDALYLALKSLNIGAGDEVILPPLSWVATINAVFLCGAKPVFVDIRDDQNINEELLKSVLTKRTKAIIPVHFTGRLCRMGPICNFAKENKLFVIEDAAQAFGARLDGVPAGGFGDMGCFSMNPMKVLASFGEAGAIVTNNKIAYNKLIALRYLGTIKKEKCFWPSLNSKIDNLQACFLNQNIKSLDAIISKRIKIASFYSESLNPLVKTPFVEKETKKNRPNTFFSYAIQTKHRNKLKKYLEKRGIEAKIHHPILMPDQPAYRKLYKARIPVAKKVVKTILSLPIHENLAKKDVKYVIQTIKNFFKYDDDKS